MKVRILLRAMIVSIYRRVGIKSLIILFMAVVVFIIGCVLIYFASKTPRVVLCSHGIQEILINNNVNRKEVIRIENDSLAAQEYDALDDRKPEKAVYKLIKSHKIVGYDRKLSIKRCSHPPLIVLAINSAADHFDRRQGIRQTWGNGDEFKIRFDNKDIWKLVFIVARSGNTAIDELVDEEALAYGDLLIINMKDHHKLLTDKTLLGMHWAVMECKARFYYKGDDDVWVNKWRLLDYMTSITSNPDSDLSNTWIGFISGKNRIPVRDKTSKYYVSVQDFSGNQFPVYCSGFSYLMTKATAIKMIQAVPHIKKIAGIDDAYMGLLANYSGIRPRHDHKFHFRTYREQRIYTAEILYKYISEHGINNANLMEKMNDLVKYKYIFLSKDH